MTTRAVLFFLFLALPCLVLAQATSQGYHSYGEMTKVLERLQSQYKDVVHLQSLGKTQEGRDIWVVALRKGNPEQPRAMLIVGGVEASQIAGSELAVRAIEYLASNYGKQNPVTQLLEHATVYVLPRVNPDATESYAKVPSKERSINTRPVDDDRDGQTDEDDTEDLNGDGLITWMRVKDSQGEWMVHPDDPRIMKKAVLANNERGEYKLYAEGIDNDGDEQWNEDPKGGVNFNKNFTFNYTYFGEGAGIYQISEPETRAVADFIFSHPSISVIMSFSPNDNLMKPWKADPRAGAAEDGRGIVKSVMKEDESYYQFIGKHFQEITGFKDAPKSQKGEGDFCQWAYYHAGRWSFSTFPWWAPNIQASTDSTRRRTPGPGSSGRNDKAEGQDDETAMLLQTLRWYDAAGRSDIALAWSPYQHRDFPGKIVEIGGVKPFALENPPVDSLAGRADAFNAFFVDLAEKLPSISVRNVKVTTLRSGVYRINVDVVNDGYFPTNSTLGHRLRWVRDVAVTMELGKGQSVASGSAKQILDPIDGNGSAKSISWVVLGAPGSVVTVKAESPACGTASERIELR